VFLEQLPPFSGKFGGRVAINLFNMLVCMQFGGGRAAQSKLLAPARQSICQRKDFDIGGNSPAGLSML